MYNNILHKACRVILGIYALMYVNAIARPMLKPGEKFFVVLNVGNGITKFYSTEFGGYNNYRYHSQSFYERCLEKWGPDLCKKLQSADSKPHDLYGCLCDKMRIKNIELLEPKKERFRNEVGKLLFNKKKREEMMNAFAEGKYTRTSDACDALESVVDQIWMIVPQHFPESLTHNPKAFNPFFPIIAEYMGDDRRLKTSLMNIFASDETLKVKTALKQTFLNVFDGICRENEEFKRCKWPQRYKITGMFLACHTRESIHYTPQIEEEAIISCLDTLFNWPLTDDCASPRLDIERSDTQQVEVPGPPGLWVICPPPGLWLDQTTTQELDPQPMPTNEETEYQNKLLKLFELCDADPIGVPMWKARSTNGKRLVPPVNSTPNAAGSEPKPGDVTMPIFGHESIINDVMPYSLSTMD